MPNISCLGRKHHTSDQAEYSAKLFPKVQTKINFLLYVGITAFYRREPSAKDHLHEQIISTDLQRNYPISKFMLKLLNVGVIYMKIISLKGVEVVKVSIFLITYVSEVV